jgi:hypothetical protein
MTSCLRALSLKAPWVWVNMRAQKPRFQGAAGAEGSGEDMVRRKWWVDQAALGKRRLRT